MCKSESRIHVSPLDRHRAAWSGEDATTRHYRGRDRVAELAIESAGRKRVHRCMCPSCQQSRAGAAAPDASEQARPSGKPRSRARSAYVSSSDARIVASRRNGGALELVVRDAPGRNIGISRSEGVWLCQCAPEWENPGCRHQQAAEAWRSVFS